MTEKKEKEKKIGFWNYNKWLFIILGIIIGGVVLYGYYYKGTAPTPEKMARLTFWIFVVFVYAIFEYYVLKKYKRKKKK